MSYTPFKMRGPSLYNSPMKEDKELGDLSKHVEEKSLDLPKMKTKEERDLEEKKRRKKANPSKSYRVAVRQTKKVAKKEQ